MADIQRVQGNRWTGFAVGVLLLIHGLILTHTAWRKSATVDEVAHLPAGITYWEKRTFAVYHHNPPLVKLLAALPVMAAGGKVDYSGNWLKNQMRGLPVSQWNLGWEFMYANARRYRLLYFLGRLVPVAFSCLGLVLAARLGGKIGGPSAAVASACLWCFSPNLLAHGCLITTDVPATVMCLATVLATLHWCGTHRVRESLALGFVLGIAQLTKFSLLILYLLVPTIALWLSPRSWKKLLSQFLLTLAVSLTVINAGYFFEGTGKRLEDYQFLSALLTRPRATAPKPGEIPSGHPWAYVLEIRENRFKGTLLGKLPVPLPAHYVLGFDEQRLEAEGIPGPDGRLHGYYVYLCGQLRDQGWWYYYFVAIALKVPLGTLLMLLCWAALVCSGYFRPNRAQLASMLAGVAFIVVMSLATDINLGIRYVLPALPLMFVPAACLTTGPVAWVRILTVGALLWNAAAVARIHPHYLAYFNEIAGGPANGHRFLIDSNIDWGQDLYELADWLQRNRPGARVGLAYFGNVDPAILRDLGYEVEYTLAPPRSPEDLSLLVVAPDAPLRKFLEEWATKNSDLLVAWQSDNPGRSPLDMPALKEAILEHLHVPPAGSRGLYAVSVNFLRRLPFRLRDQESNLWDFARLPDGRRGDPYSYFLGYEPIARIGYSIYVFELR